MVLGMRKIQIKRWSVIWGKVSAMLLHSLFKDPLYIGSWLKSFSLLVWNSMRGSLWNKNWRLSCLTLRICISYGASEFPLTCFTNWMICNLNRIACQVIGKFKLPKQLRYFIDYCPLPAFFLPNTAVILLCEDSPFCILPFSRKIKRLIYKTMMKMHRLKVSAFLGSS